MAQTVSDPPFLTPLVDKSGRIIPAWLNWLIGPAPGAALAIAQGVQQSVITPIDPVVLTAQTATIATTPFPLGNNPGGLYRLSFYTRITTPASVSSSLTVGFSWTDGGVACTASGTALTGNTTNATQSGATVIRSDASAPMNFSTIYASVGTPMAYRLDAILESLGT